MSSSGRSTRPVLCLVLLVGCAGRPFESADPACANQTPASFARDVQPILRTHCAGIECHSATFHLGSAYRNLVSVVASECHDGRLLVAPGSPSASYLLDKLEGSRLCFGERMPKGRAPLDDAAVATIRGWICAGAIDD